MTLTGARLLAFRGRASSTSFLTAAKRHDSFKQQRFQHSFSSLLYPLASEAPEISVTSVDKVAEIRKHPKNEPLDKKFPPPHEPDHFDDAHILSELEEDSIRKLQKQHLPTTLSGCTKITPDIPPNIPHNVPSKLLEIPKTLQTTLDNGVQVVSQETYGQVSCIGILINVGSRHESVTGTSHLLETMAFHSTDAYSAVEIPQQLQEWGATSFANTGREQTLYCLDILRPNVEKGMELLSQVVLSPRLLEEEVYHCKKAMEYQWMDIMPIILSSELLQQAAYGNDQQLGKPHFCKLCGRNESIQVGEEHARGAPRKLCVCFSLRRVCR